MSALYIPKAGSFQAIVEQLETIKTLDPNTYQIIEAKFKEVKPSDTSLPIQMAAFAAEDSIHLNHENLQKLMEQSQQQSLQENEHQELVNLRLKLQNQMDARLEFQKFIDTRYKILNANQPHHVERHQLNRWQAEIKAVEKPNAAGLVFARTSQTDVVMRLNSVIKKINHPIRHMPNHDVTSILHFHAGTMHKLLTPSVKIQRDKKTGLVTETAYSFAEFKKNPPDIIFIMGNNDLRQVSFVAELYAALVREKSPKLPKIYVSGYGGHGTMHDPVFSLTEGATMVKRLLDQGVPQENIVVEYDAVDTGRNVKYMDTIFLIEFILNYNQELLQKPEKNLAETQYLLKMDLTRDKIAFLEHMLKLDATKRTGEQDTILEDILKVARSHLKKINRPIFPNILISGTPGGLLRQTRTYEKQTTLPWENICCLTPHEFLPSEENPSADPYKTNYYYASKDAALINFIYALREVASFLDYTANKEFISDRMIAPEFEHDLTESIDVFMYFYSLLAKPNYLPSAKEFADDFISFSKYKSEGKTNTPECKTLREKLNLFIGSTSEYFRKAFFDIEHEYLKQENLTIKPTLNQQAESMDTGGTYGRLSLAPSTLFHRKPTAAEIAEPSEPAFQPHI
jgi:hypothetical protein